MIRTFAAGLFFAAFSVAQQPTQVSALTTPSPPRDMLSLSPNGKSAAAACGDGMLRVWDLPSGHLTRTIDPGKRFLILTAISWDGALLAGGDMEGGVTIWNTATGAEVREFHLRHYGFAMAFSPDGTRLAIAPANEPAQVYNIASGKKLFDLRQLFGGAQAVAFSNDGLRIATADSDTAVRIFDARNGELLARFTEFLMEPAAAAFTADGKWVLAAGVDKIVAVIDTSTGAAVRKSSKLADPVRTVNVSPDGALNAAWLVHADSMSQPAPVIVSETETGETVQRWQPPGLVLGSTWTHDGRLLAGIRADKVAAIWQVR